MSDRLDDLVRLRALLWESLESVDPEKLAPLAARLESVVEQIERLSPSMKAGDPVDEIAARRAERGGATARLGDTKGRAR